MKKRPYVSFQEVKDKIPIPDVLCTFGIAHQFVRKGDHLSGVCPLPQHQHGPSPNAEQFKIDRKNGIWLYKCFGDCNGRPGGAGDVVEFVKAMTGLSDAHCRFWFAANFGERLSLRKPRSVQADPETNAAREDHSCDLPQATHNSPSSLSDLPAPLKPLRFHLNLEPHVPYLRQRGLSGETIRRFSLGLCTRGLLKGYVAIPVYNWPRPDDQLPVAYLGRWPGDDFDSAHGRPRYKWPEGFPKHRVVYGLHEALRDTSSDLPLVVVEGPFGVFHLAQQGFPNATAIFGSSLSDEQAELLIVTGRPLILMFDGDEAGRHGMRTAAAKLIRRRFVRVVPLPDHTQPDDLPSERIAEFIN